jgi:hypothetical protein
MASLPASAATKHRMANSGASAMGVWGFFFCAARYSRYGQIGVLFADWMKFFVPFIAVNKQKYAQHLLLTSGDGYVFQWLATLLAMRACSLFLAQHGSI